MLLSDNLRRLARERVSLPWDFGRTCSCAIRHRTSEEGGHVVNSDSARVDGEFFRRVSDIRIFHADLIALVNGEATEHLGAPLA